MLRSGYLSVLEAKSAEDLLGRIVGFAHDMGFERVGATTVLDRGDEQVTFQGVSNMPLAYEMRAREATRRAFCPVAQHCKRTSVPIAWSQDTYTRQGLGEQWDEQERYGYGTGVALALHLPHGRHFYFGVDRREALPDSPDELTRLVADVQLFAVHACEAAARLLVPAALPDDTVSLTPRELECLRWTMDGKTAWEVGTLLGISERTAVLHVTSAARKLGCTSKHQAVIKAMRLGLIH